MGPTRSTTLVTRFNHAVVVACVLFVLGLAGGGCQQTATVTQRRIIEHQAMIDFSGLKPAEAVEHVKVHGALPRQWEQPAPMATSMYTHQQWKSPSGKTAVGIAHVRLPMPLGTKMVLWMAKREYTKRKADNGRIISEWVDEVGRPWFEAVNDKYRVRGYVAVKGRLAWIVYFGNQSQEPLDPVELSLASRAVESIVPDMGGDAPAESGKSASEQQPTTAPATSPVETAASR